METTAAGRRPPLPAPPPFAPALELGGRHDCTSGGGGCSWSPFGARWPPAGLGPEPRPVQVLWAVVACLTIPTLIFVSGVYRPPLAFISGIYVGDSTSQRQDRHPHHDPHQHQQRLVDDGEKLLSSAEAAAPSPSPSPISGEKLFSSAEDAAPPPSQSPISGEKLFSSAEAAAPPPSQSPISGEKLFSSAESAAPSPPPASTSYLQDGVLQQNNAPVAPRRSPSSHGYAHDDELLGGLLAASFDGDSCLSRHQSFAYRKASPYRPSPYLLHRLRKYEALHRRCGPLTRSYRRALGLLKPGIAAAAASSPCKYVVWNAENGLGNRMLSIASAFLYALLCGRVLLVDRSTAGLFCEPFPHSTWLLPLDFPLRHLPFGKKYPQSYGNLVRTNRSISSPAAQFLYVHLSNDYDDFDKRFYCEADQRLLDMTPWMALRSDQYFAPALFMNPAFERELNRMFPEKEAVFHHLGRYLFHPSDKVWSLITRYYKDHLAAAKDRLGIQIRVFDMKNRPFDLILRQILNCTVSEKLLPEVNLRRHAVAGETHIGPPSKAVLLTSLHSVFYERMKNMYAGEAAVGVHQPSHEEKQRKGRAAHDGQALAEMYLLSLTDALVTSARSTFGYVAQALAGVTPRVLLGPVQLWVPEPACVRDLSPEPCLHFPPNYDCETRGHADMEKLVPYTRHCKDVSRGVKLVDARH